MRVLDISTPILKEHKVLQVDFFDERVVETRKDSLINWDDQGSSKQQDKLMKYFENEQAHNEKYFGFKKMLTEKYFKRELSDDYNDTTISDTIEGEQFFRSSKMKSIASKMYESMQIDNSSYQFCSNFETYKSSRLKKGKSKNISRYLSDNKSLINQQEQFQFEPPLSRNRKNRTGMSIYQHSHTSGVQKSFMMSTIRPVSQQITRKAQRMKNLFRDKTNPESPENIRHKLKGLSERRKKNDAQNKQQQKSILDIISHQKLMKYLAESKSIDPKKKGIFSIDDLTDIQKYQMSFTNYMKLKTKTKLDNYIIENKVKPKTGNLDKFQEFILDQFQIDNDSRRKLFKIFEDIKYQFQTVERRKKIQKR